MDNDPVKAMYDAIAQTLEEGEKFGMVASLKILNQVMKECPAATVAELFDAMFVAYDRLRDERRPGARTKAEG